MAFVRRLAGCGLQNCRDLGGFAASGGVTKFGVFLRSEAPCALKTEDIAALREYGLNISFDLRGEPEIRWRPSALEGEFTYEKIPLAGGAETFDKKNLPEGDFGWDKVYIRRAQLHPDWFRDAFTACAEAEGCALYHCTTGKDRTGILTCCLLGAVGVSREDIAADYCLSQVYLQEMFAAMRAGSLTIRPGDNHFEEYVFQTPFTAMTAFYDFLVAEYGSVTGYLLHIGVNPETIEKLRQKFVE